MPHRIPALTTDIAERPILNEVEAARLAALRPLINLLIEETRDLFFGEIVIEFQDGRPHRIVRSQSIRIR